MSHSIPVPNPVLSQSCAEFKTLQCYRYKSCNSLPATLHCLKQKKWPTRALVLTMRTEILNVCMYTERLCLCCDEHTISIYYGGLEILSVDNML